MGELTDLRSSPLQHLAEAFAAASVAGEHGVALREVPFLTQIGLRARAGCPVHAALAQATGVGLPAHAREVTGTADGTAVLWLGPDEFLLVADPQRADDVVELFAALREALGGNLPGQVVDLSAARAVLELSGPSARAVLESGVPADLHPRVLGPGTAITTLLGPVPLVLWQAGAERYRLLPRASFAVYTAQWLLDAMQEFSRPHQ